ncbi:MAG TPA: AzlC family ABC transporter permease [bacterium]|jgi:predicted branched-subunit amino acid permease|nr:AzlC family ABC transporter permease [bacterium]
MTSRKSEFLAGVKAEIPILLGVVPFGLIFGVVALEAGLPPWPAFAMSSVVFAGSAQFIGVQLFGLAAPPLVILLTTLVVNLRHLLYGASVAPYLKPLRPAWKWVLAYLMTDEAYAVAITNYTAQAGKRASEHAPPHPGPLPLDPHPHPLPQAGEGQGIGPKGARERTGHWFFLGAGLTLWVSWQASTAAGILLGAQIPASWSLAFALPLTFIALVRPALTDRGTVLAAATAGVVAVLAFSLPYKLGLMVAALGGIVMGLVTERE